MTAELDLFRNNLTTALNKRNLTPESCAAKCRIPREEFQSYYNGTVIPDPQRLTAISEALNVKVADLAGDAPISFTSFGHELRAIREAEGLTRNDLSELTGIPYKSLTNYERDIVRHVEAKNIQKLEDILGEKITAAISKYGMKPVKKAKAAPKPKPKAKAASVADTRTKTGGLKREWIKMLNYIKSDSEFRKAIMVLIAHALDGSPITEIPDAPEANLILRMIRDK